MTRFYGGPADGQTLQVARAPRFLRVVVDAQGKIDALDQLDDTPAADETIHVYEIQANPGRAHIDSRDSRTGKRIGRWVEIADYALHPNQPADHEVRETSAWQAWCRRAAK